MNPITAAWQSLAWPSTVVVQLTATSSALIGTGCAVGRTDQGIPFAYSYSVTLTPDWEIRRVVIVSLLDGRRIDVARASGKWYTDSRVRLPEFDGIDLFDLSISPFTNSLPVKRLTFDGSKPQTVNMVYFDENSFSLRKVRQQYSRIGDRTYRYQDVELSGFIADLTVDEAGLVVDFDRLFRRI